MKKTLPGGAQPPDDPGAPAAPLDPRYTAWFGHFNAGEYYEAHEVLEVLWLRTNSSERDFFKGLIQVAGAFVHLRKQRENPPSAAGTTRLRPAARLFRRCSENLAPYGRAHLQLDVAAVRTLCDSLADAIESSDFTENPWDPAAPPHIGLGA